MIIGVIPARAGTQELHDKNLQKIGPLSLVQWAAEAARDVPLIERVICTTNHKEILNGEHTLPNYVEIVDRPSELSGPEVSIVDVLQDILESRPAVSHVVLLNPTSPFRTSETVSRCVTEAINGGYALVFTAVDTVVESHLWHVETEGSTSVVRNKARARWQDNATQRVNRQSLPTCKQEHGACYVIARHVVLSGRLHINTNTKIVTTPEVEAIDIDTELDLHAARGVYVALKSNGHEVSDDITSSASLSLPGYGGA